MNHRQNGRDRLARVGPPFCRWRLHLIVYPQCPECGEVAAHQPAISGTGSFCYLVYHDHGCRVSKYAACITEDGRQDNVPIHGERFEDVVGDAA